ncbi:hypothetical protein DFJ73DRAFT_966485 [Zopfochytrium polystomum]|nr:hypothetical protein DFJ73DRAFT_966485 [Zopfochytrium polystomum]
MQLSFIASVLLSLGVADLALAKNCIWTQGRGGAKDILVWDDNVQDFRASHYWNWHYDNVACFKDTFNLGNGYMSVAINDGARKMGFYYNNVIPGTYPDQCFTNSCSFVETGGNSFASKWMPDNGFRTINYCDLNKVSCKNEGTNLKTGEDCTCLSSGFLLGELSTLFGFEE